MNEFKVKIPDFIKNFIMEHNDVFLVITYTKSDKSINHQISIRRTKESEIFLLNDDELQCMEKDRLNTWYSK